MLQCCKQTFLSLLVSVTPSLIIITNNLSNGINKVLGKKKSFKHLLFVESQKCQQGLSGPISIQCLLKYKSPLPLMRPSLTISSHECSAFFCPSMPFCELECFVIPVITVISYFYTFRMTARAIVTTKTPSH